ncbi:MAG: glycosyltransferase family 4 protein [Candidatus Omnitrophica bacterium]|nr:glycosyltransferase family 4 protein [Candidatus Omnitrophota bacterium]
MKVLFLTTHLNAGGITSYLLNLGKALIKNGHEAIVASSSGDMEEEFSRAGIMTAAFNIKTKSELSFKIYFALPKIIRLIKEQKVSILHSHTRITQVIGSILHIFTGVKHISTCHGYFKPKLSRKLFPCWGSKVIAISPQVRDHLLNDFKLDKGMVVLAPSGIDVDAFCLISEDGRRLKKDQFGLNAFTVIGIIARLSEVKGQDILIRAFKRVSEVQQNVMLALVGEGKFEDELKKLAVSLKLEDKIKFIPTVNRTADILQMFDVFVMPSRQEGLGLGIMEALASGLPVVASNIGGIPSLIENNVTGLLFEPGDDEQLAYALIRLIDDKVLCKKLRVAGRERIEQKFSLDQMASRIIGIYEENTGN